MARRRASPQAIVHAVRDTYHLVRSDAHGGNVERADCTGASIVEQGSRRFVQCENPGPFRKACD